MPKLLDAFETQKVERLKLKEFMNESRKDKINNRQAYYNMLEAIINMINNHGGGQIEETNEKLCQKLGLIACCDNIFINHLEKQPGFEITKGEVVGAADIFGKLVVEEYYKEKETN